MWKNSTRAFYSLPWFLGEATFFSGGGPKSGPRWTLAKSMRGGPGRPVFPTVKSPWCEVSCNFAWLCLHRISTYWSSHYQKFSPQVSTGAKLRSTMRFLFNSWNVWTIYLFLLLLLICVTLTPSTWKTILTSAQNAFHLFLVDGNVKLFQRTRTGKTLVSCKSLSFFELYTLLIQGTSFRFIDHSKKSWTHRSLSKPTIFRTRTAKIIFLFVRNIVKPHESFYYKDTEWICKSSWMGFKTCLSWKLLNVPFARFSSLETGFLKWSVGIWRDRTMTWDTFGLKTQRSEYSVKQYTLDKTLSSCMITIWLAWDN